ncbi:MAG: hypothetical protein IH950_16310 [Bacteroidetes bacterium]|nr:hypothetical protein [Bacteroidota bacterium]
MLYPIKIGRTTKQFSKNRNSFKIGFGFSFNPNFDGNALAWYDGNIALSNTQWDDQGAGGHNISFFNTPVIVSGATPLRDAVRFDGVNQGGFSTTPNLNQPYTVYLVVNSISFFANGRIFDNGTGSNNRLFQAGTSPNLNVFGGSTLAGNPDLSLGTFGVMAIVFNNLSGEIRTNLNTAVSGTIGANNNVGFSIGARQNQGNACNCEIGYLIFRAGGDSTAIQDYIIGSLRTICGLTF